MIDLFGNEVVKPNILRDKYVEPPFTILDTKTGTWQGRKKKWIAMGIKGEVGRDAAVIHLGEDSYNKEKGESSSTQYVSIFDPTLCEVLYKWFCPEGGKILDPFAGGSVRGIVANSLGYHYTGIDIRPEQIEANVKQAIDILSEDERPTWICGDSNKVLRTIEDDAFDMVFSCPPYADLEVYSDIEGDISNMSYPEFKIAYRKIISQSCEKLKKGGIAVFVVGEVRGKDGGYIGLFPKL